MGWGDVDVREIQAHDEHGVRSVQNLDLVDARRVGQTYAEWTETP
jgi:hypothetical protein